MLSWVFIVVSIVAHKTKIYVKKIFVANCLYITLGNIHQYFLKIVNL